MGVALALVAASALSQGTATSNLAPQDGGAIEVGTALTWRITVEDPSFDGASLPEPQLGVEWAVIDGPRDMIDADLSSTERPGLVREWTLLPLAGGTLVTPTLTATLEGGATIEVPASAVEVLPSLGETEEAPRPLLGFREAPDRRVGDPRAALLALIGVLAAGAGLFLWRRSVLRRRSFVPPPPPEKSAIEQLRALDPTASAAGTTMAALAPLFRRAFDQGLPSAERTRRSSLTDDDWGREVEAIAGDRGADAARLIHELSGYRYGGGEPTSFAVKDALQRASELATSAPVGEAG